MSCRLVQPVLWPKRQAVRVAGLQECVAPAGASGTGRCIAIYHHARARLYYLTLCQHPYAVRHRVGTYCSCAFPVLHN